MLNTLFLTSLPPGAVITAFFNLWVFSAAALVTEQLLDDYHLGDRLLWGRGAITVNWVTLTTRMPSRADSNLCRISTKMMQASLDARSLIQ